MAVVLITGSAGLIGSESAFFFARKGFTVVGVDNDMRSYFFGDEASTLWNRQRLTREIATYAHYATDIRNRPEMEKIFKEYGSDVALVIHAAAQPSHDWAAGEPAIDFSVNAGGTLNLLELTRQYCPGAVFIFTSTNKVYGDTPNTLPLRELEDRWEIEETHPYFARGIDESMSIDQSKHSVFGASKAAADLMVQEYGRYFSLRTACFRGGCLTGPNHSGAELHGFLSYLVKCAMTGKHYTVFGYKGKQVRDNIHSHDLVAMFWHFFNHPRSGEVYNAGGGRHSNCSIMEAIRLCEKTAGKKIEWSYSNRSRSGDHIWWISDTRKFESHYPEWRYSYTLDRIVGELYESHRARL
jgi:CDP-paratose 2-epimerase